MGGYTSDETILKDRLDEGERAQKIEPSVVQSIHKLANLYCAQRRYADAERLYTLVLHAQERVLGTNNDDVADSLTKVAIILRQLGRQNEASVLEFRAKSLWSSTAG